jgi:hypothetical protein
MTKTAWVKEIKYLYWAVKVLWDDGSVKIYNGFKSVHPGNFASLVRDSVKRIALVQFEDSVDFYALEDAPNAFQELRRFLEDCKEWEVQVFVAKIEQEEVIGKI